MTGLATIALISNPRSTGNIALLPEIRAFIAANQNIYHYEIDDVAQVPEALRQIARIEPDILAINGGDGTCRLWEECCAGGAKANVTEIRRASGRCQATKCKEGARVCSTRPGPPAAEEEGTVE